MFHQAESDAPGGLYVRDEGTAHLRNATWVSEDCWFWQCPVCPDAFGLLADRDTATADAIAHDRQWHNREADRCEAEAARVDETDDALSRFLVDRGQSPRRRAVVDRWRAQAARLRGESS